MIIKKVHYYCRYNAIKHDRIKNLHKADIYTLIRILGALYILNVYYKNENKNVTKDKYPSSLEKQEESIIFKYEIFPCLDEVILDSDKNSSIDNCLYKIVRKVSDYAIRINYMDIFDEKKSMLITKINSEFQKYLKEKIGESIEPKELLKKIFGDDEALMKEMYTNNKIKDIVSIGAEKMKSSYWMVLNKDND